MFNLFAGEIAPPTEVISLPLGKYFFNVYWWAYILYIFISLASHILDLYKANRDLCASINNFCDAIPLIYFFMCA